MCEHIIGPETAGDYLRREDVLNLLNKNRVFRVKTCRRLPWPPASSIAITRFFLKFMVTAPYEVSVWGTLLMVLYSGKSREQTKYNCETCMQAKH